MQDEQMKVDDDWPKRTKQVNRGIKRDKTSNDENTNKGDQKSGKQQVSREELSEWSGRSVKIEKKDRENEGGSGDKRQQAEHTVIPSQQCCWGCNLTLRQVAIRACVCMQVCASLCVGKQAGMGDS